MAPGSPSAIQAISDRPLTERPEAKSSDSSDGQFASLMAQFARTPKATKAPEPSPARPARLDKGPRTPAAKTQTSTAPEMPTAPVEASPSTDGPRSSKAEVQTPGADGASPVADTKTAKVDPGKPGAPLKADSSSDDSSSDNAPAAQAGVLASLRPLDAVPAKAAAQVLTPGDPTTAPAGVLPTAPSSPPTPPTIPAQPEALPPAGAGSTANSGSASDPNSLRVQAEASVPTEPQPASQPTPQTTPQLDPAQLKAQASSQAVIADMASRMKGGPRPEGSGLPSDTTATNATPVVKSLQAADAQALSTQRVEAQTDPAAGPLPTDPGSAGSQGANKPGTSLPSANPESTLPTLEALAARSAALTPTPALHGPDGSALVATSLLPRAGEPLTVSPPATPQAPAAQPSAPVLQVEGGLRWMLKGGTQEAQLQLHPDSLGQVTIHLKVVGSEVHARLWITEPGSVQAVQEGRPHLEMALKEQGLQLGSFDLQQGQQPFQEAPTASPTREPSFQEVAPARQEAPAAPAPSILNSRHVELYA